MSGWVIHPRMRNSHYRLSIIYAKLEDSGTYTCSTPHGQHNSLAVIVTTLSCPIIHTSDTLRGNTTDIYIGTVVAFSCPTGFILLGEDTLECRDDGKDMYLKLNTEHDDPNQVPGARRSLQAATQHNAHLLRSPHPT
jgi:hypothetical protein